MQHGWLAYECVSLVHINVADIIEIYLDRLHQPPRAHVMQKRVGLARAEECRVCESVRASRSGEGQPRPRPEVTTGRVQVVRGRGERRYESLTFIRW